MNLKTLFFIGLILSATGVISPFQALCIGLIYGLSCVHPCLVDSRALSKFLLQASVVGLGFGMNLHEILRVGRSGFVYTAVSIAVALIGGVLVGRMLRVTSNSSLLITVGTAICGGSAIAVMAPVIRADDEDIAVSLGIIFVLNSIALFVFPIIGGAAHLSQQQFGLWSALAIHDTSSVVGATSSYGPLALEVGTTVKLTRALWIVPISLGLAALKGRSTGVQWPWFILLFSLAAIVNTYVSVCAEVFHVLSNLGKLGLTTTLYLIGTGISRKTLQQVGMRPLLQGVILWLLVTITSLWLIAANVMRV